MTDNELMTTYAATKDNRIADEIYRRYWQRLVDLTTKRLNGDSDTAEDIAQMTLIEVLKNADKFDPERCTLFGWMILIAGLRQIDEYRKVVNRPMLADMKDTPARA